ncbi:hypothetical protein GCM10027176_46410 [Actinoallomurus bryophytorum]
MTLDHAATIGTPIHRIRNVPNVGRSRNSARPADAAERGQREDLDATGALGWGRNAATVSRGPSWRARHERLAHARDRGTAPARAVAVVVDQVFGRLRACCTAQEPVGGELTPATV